MDDILRDVALELAEGTKLGETGVYPAHMNTEADEDNTSTLGENKQLSDADEVAREIVEMIHFGGVVE